MATDAARKAALPKPARKDRKLRLNGRSGPSPLTHRIPSFTTGTIAHIRRFDGDPEFKGETIEVRADTGLYRVSERLRRLTVKTSTVVERRYLVPRKRLVVLTNGKR